MPSWVDLEWDDEAVEHIARHGVEPEEVEEAVWSGEARMVRTRGRGSRRRYIIYGRTAAGRYLKVVVERIAGRRFRPVTAYEMDDRDRRTYRRLLGAI